MKMQSFCLGVVCLVSMIFVDLASGQEASAKDTSPKVTPGTFTETSPTVSAEEKVVRAAYEKLTLLSRGALQNNGPEERRREF